MKNFVVTSFGILLAIVAASPDCWAAVLSNSMVAQLAWVPISLYAENWSDIMLCLTLCLALDRHAINDGFVVNVCYTVATTSVASLIVGADCAGDAGTFGTAGTLNMSDGKLIVTGGGDSFEIGRACCDGARA